MARDYRHEYDTYQKDKSSYRAKLNKINRDNPNSKKGDGKDVSHKGGCKYKVVLVLEDSSVNKGRKEKSRKKGSKRKPWRFWKKSNKKKNK